MARWIKNKSRQELIIFVEMKSNTRKEEIITVASRLFKEKGFSVNTTDVFAISLDNTPGTATNVITLFTKAKINISYLYSFLIENKGILVFRTDNPDKTKEIIILNKLSLFKL